MAVAALLFDFDGVIADSETLFNAILAESITQLGLPMTCEEAMERYMGGRWAETLAAIERDLGRSLPPRFQASLSEATHARFRAELRAVDGVAGFLDGVAHLPRAIASSSSAEGLALSLGVLGLGHWFGPHVYSAEFVARGKPHPDIYLLAAGRLAVPPAACVVVEDSPRGVRAGRAAGMTVVGLCAASHIRPGHDLRLMEAGAHHIAASWRDVARLVEQLA